MSLVDAGSVLDELAPVRQRRGLIEPIPPTPPRADPAQIDLAIDIVGRSGIVEWLEPHMPYQARQRRSPTPGGRSPSVGLEAVLVGLLLLAMLGRPIFIRDIARLIDTGIGPRARRRLGLPRGGRITERMVSRTFNHFAELIDPSVHSDANQWMFDAENVRQRLGLADDVVLDDWDIAHFADVAITEKRLRLDRLIRLGCVATHPDDYEHTGDLLIDGSYISSWENPRTNRRRTSVVLPDGSRVRQPVRHREMADPDAMWWKKKNDGPIGSKGALAGTAESGLGYVLSAISWTEPVIGVNQRPPATPLLIDHFSVIPARGGIWRVGAELTERLMAHYEDEDLAAGRDHRVRGDILGDREYSRVEAWQWRMHVIGLTPHFRLAKEQRIVTVLASGVVIIDGIPYSPGIPLHLRTPSAQVPFANREDRAAQARLAREREPYRLRVLSRARQDDGSLILYCAASTLAHASMQCANKPSSFAGPAGRITVGTALPVITAATKPAVCTQTQITLSFHESRFWQPHIPGSPEHQWAVNRRSNVEGAFARIKDPATHSLRRGQFRIFGTGKVGVAVLVNVMAANLREVERWRRRRAEEESSTERRPKKSRIPRRHTRARIAAKQHQQQLLEMKASLEDLAAQGLLVDPDTGEILASSSPP